MSLFSLGQATIAIDLIPYQHLSAYFKIQKLTKSDRVIHLTPSLQSLFVCLLGFLTSSSTTTLYRGRVPRLTSDKCMCCHTRDRAGRPMTSVSAGPIILTPTQPVGSGRPQRGSNPGPPHQESCALPTKLPRPLSAVTK